MSSARHVPHTEGEPRAALDYDSSAAEVLRRLGTEFRGVKLLALGQTVFWDEPLKATLRRALDDFALDAEMVLGVHDTDYFSKLHHPTVAKNGYRLLPHNDGSTRDLWAAAAEISQLFGSETVISRDRYLEHGVAFDKVAQEYPGGRDELVEKKTEAWGWRGLASTSQDPCVTAELPAADVLPALRDMVDWAFIETLAALPCPEQRERAEAVVHGLHDLLIRHGDAYPDWTLTDFYQHLLPHLFELLLGYRPQNVSFTGTVKLLTLNRATAGLRRFRLLDCFLRPETRRACAEAYDDALEGSAMYTLDQFGPGALPFDLVIPGQGRGTLRLAERYAVVMTPRPVFVSLRQPIESVEQLAAWIEDTFGPETAAIGKAVTLVPMLAGEFLFVFHEQGSEYVYRSRRMIDGIRAAGIEYEPMPILRLRYDTWGALSATPVWLRLPEHLAAAFGQDEIQGPSFAERWRNVVAEQRELLAELSDIHRPRDLILLLRKRLGGSWEALAERYEGLQERMRKLEADLRDSREEISRLFGEWRESKAACARLEREKGEDFRTRLKPLLDRQAAGETGLKQEIQAEVERRKAEFEVKLTLLRRRVRETRQEIENVRADVRRRVRAPEALEAHDARREIEREAELARLRLVRNAILTADGLTLTSHRPAAWWLPMLSPDGSWFERVAATAQMYFEELHN